MALQTPQPSSATSDLLLPAVGDKRFLLGCEVKEKSSEEPPSAEAAGAEREEVEGRRGGKDSEAFAPPLTASGGLERGPKSDISPFNNFISTISQKQEDAGSSPTQFVIADIKNVKDLPSVGHDVRQKQRNSVDVIPAEMKVSIPPELPSQTKTLKEFQEDIEKAKLSGDWKTVYEFYSATFDSFQEVNAAFKKSIDAPFNSIEDCGIDAKFVNSVYEALLNTPQDIQKCILKGIINGLLQEWKGPRSKDDLRAYFILLQNPLFSNTSTYVIYAHLLRQIAALTEGDHHFLIHWFKK